MTLVINTINVGDNEATILTKMYAMLKAIDEHDHSINRGVTLKLSDIEITGDLDFQNNAINNAEVYQFDTYTVDNADTIPDDKDIMYYFNGDAYLKHAGNPPIQLTANGVFNTSLVGGIGGDYDSTDAAIIYDDISEAFYFTTDGVTPASAHVGALCIVAEDSTITSIEPPESMPEYTLQLPPSATGLGILTLDEVGDMGYIYYSTPTGIHAHVLQNTEGVVAPVQLTLSLLENEAVEDAYKLIQVTPDGLAPVGTSAFRLPMGTTAERPLTPVIGMFRFNVTLNALEVYNGTSWAIVVTSASATGLLIEDLSDVNTDTSEPYMYLRYNATLSQWEPRAFPLYDWNVEPEYGIDGQPTNINDGIIYNKPIDVTDLAEYEVKSFGNITVINPDFIPEAVTVLELHDDARLLLTDNPATFAVQAMPSKAPMECEWQLFGVKPAHVAAPREVRTVTGEINLQAIWNEWGDVLSVYAVGNYGTHQSQIFRYPAVELYAPVKPDIPIKDGSIIRVGFDDEIEITTEVLSGTYWGNIIGTFDTSTKDVSGVSLDDLTADKIPWGSSHGRVLREGMSIFDFEDIYNNNLTHATADTVIDGGYIVKEYRMVEGVLRKVHVVKNIEANPLREIGDLYVHNGTNSVRLPSLKMLSFLTADSEMPTGLKWGFGRDLPVGYPQDIDGNPVMAQYPVQYFIYGGGAAVAPFSGGPVPNSITDITVYNRGIDNGSLTVTYSYSNDPGNTTTVVIDEDSEIGEVFTALSELASLTIVPSLFAGARDILKPEIVVAPLGNHTVNTFNPAGAALHMIVDGKHIGEGRQLPYLMLSTRAPSYMSTQGGLREDAVYVRYNKYEYCNEIPLGWVDDPVGGVTYNVFKLASSPHEQGDMIKPVSGGWGNIAVVKSATNSSAPWITSLIPLANTSVASNAPDLVNNLSQGIYKASYIPWGIMTNTYKRWWHLGLCAPAGTVGLGATHFNDASKSNMSGKTNYRSWMFVRTLNLHGIALNSVDTTRFTFTEYTGHGSAVPSLTHVDGIYMAPAGQLVVLSSYVNTVSMKQLMQYNIDTTTAPYTTTAQEDMEHVLATALGLSNVRGYNFYEAGMKLAVTVVDSAERRIYLYTYTLATAYTIAGATTLALDLFGDVPPDLSETGFFIPHYRETLTPAEGDTEGVAMEVFNIIHRDSGGDKLLARLVERVNINDVYAGEGVIIAYRPFGIGD